MQNVKEALEAVSDYTDEYYYEVCGLLDKPEFLSIKNNVKNKRDVFIKKMIKFEMKVRFLFPEDRELDSNKLRKLKSLEMLAYCIYYKFFSNPSRKVSVNDVIDVLIMTTVPYVHTFISERNSIGIMKQLKKQTTLISSVNLLTLSDLR